jgi:filamentous hemagglutinin family protein
MKNTAKVAALSIVKNNPQTRGIFQPGFKKNALIAALSLALAPLAAHAGPSGGQISTGAGSISQSGLTTNITQQTKNLAINWTNFNINANETVNFAQPSASSIVVNRVLNQNPSKILGNVNANGQVYVINPSGVVFGKGAQVNVGSLVASTQNLTDANLNAGNITFSGNSANTITNQGSLNAANGGYVALIGSQVNNEGFINATSGTALLAAGNQVSLTLNNGSLISYNIDQGSVAALSSNTSTGTITADGGKVLLSAQAASNLSSAVVNNSGILQARTLQNVGGVIKLMGDMGVGSVKVDGTIDVSAPNGGDSGFTETSAAHVNVADTARVSSLSTSGKNGEWLIDPVDFTIAATGGNMTGAAVTAALATGAVNIQSSSGTSGTLGDMNVNDVITWAANQLTLGAQNNININANMTATGTGTLSMQYGLGALASGNVSTIITAATKSITLPAGLTYSTTQGSNGVSIPWTIITTLGVVNSVTGTDLQGMKGNLNLNYALGANIDATATTTWAGFFIPVGTDVTLGTTTFNGHFDGLGHTITNLKVSNAGGNGGLFGATYGASIIRNIGMVGGSITSTGVGVPTTAGNLIGSALCNLTNCPNINNSYSTGVISGTGNNVSAGGLIGYINGGSISNSYATGAISGVNNNTGGSGYSGGLAGQAYGVNFLNNYASGNVTATATAGNVNNSAGGLVGVSFSSKNIINCHASGIVSHLVGLSSTLGVGGLVGTLTIGSVATISNSYATGNVLAGGISGGGNVGGLFGYVTNSASGTTFTNIYATGNVSGGYNVGGLIGSLSSTLAVMAINNSYASGNATGNGGVGGFIGANNNNAGSTMDTVHSSGTISSSSNTGNNFYGGLIGSNAGSIISNSYSTSNLIFTTGSQSNVGGLIGYSSNGTINNSYATGTIGNGAFLNSYIGGLIGNNNLATVTNSYSSSNITATGNAVGGFIGSNNGTIDKSYATGYISGASITTGGFIGSNGGTISNSYATGAISGAGLVGGFIGSNGGTINKSYSTGAVSCTASICGGFSGMNGGIITSSYATGNVSSSYSNAAATVVGGFIGNNAGNISKNYATGTVTTTGAITSQIGGFAGFSTKGVLSENYTSSKITNTAGATSVGGFIGYLQTTVGNGHLITNNIAVGSITGPTATSVGGFVGNNIAATPTNNFTSVAVPATAGGFTGIQSGTGTTPASNYWNTNTAVTMLAGAGTPTGLTTAEALLKASFVGFDFTNIFTQQDGLSVPLIKSILIPVTITPLAASKVYDGTTSTPAITATYSVTPTATLLGTLAISSVTATNAGSYTITASGQYSTQQVGGYLPTFATSAYTITKAPVTISGIAATNRTYNASTVNSLTGTPSLVGLIGTQTLALSGVVSGTLDSANAGARNVTTAGVLGNGLNGGLAANYSLIQSVLPATISPASVNVTGITAVGKVYNGNTAISLTGTGAITGLVTGQALILGSTTTANTAGPDAGLQNVISNFTIANGAGGLASNYVVNQTTLAPVTITPSPITVSGLSGVSRPYNGNNSVFVTGTPSFVGLFGTDKLGLTGTAHLNLNDINASLIAKNQFLSIDLVDGSVGCAVGSVCPGLASNYYTIPSSSVNGFNITPATINIGGMSGTDRPFDGTNIDLLTGVPIFQGLAPGELLTISGNGILPANPPVAGIQNVNANLVLGDGVGGLASNYTLVQPILPNVNILPAALTVSGLTAISRPYNGTATIDLAGQATEKIVGVVNPGDILVVKNNLTGTLGSKNAGLQQVTTNITLENANGSVANYTFIQPTLPLVTITPAILTINTAGLAGVSRFYNGTFDVSISGAITFNGFILNESLSTTNAGIIDSINAGSRIVTTNFSLKTAAGVLASNYKVTQIPLTAPMIIKPALLSVSGLSSSDRIYNGSDLQPLSGTPVLQGLIGAERLLLQGQGILGSKNAGMQTVNTNYTLINSTGLASNYSLNQAKLPSIKIIPKDLLLSGLSGSIRNYDGTDINLLSGTPIYSGLVGAETVDVTPASIKTGILSSPNAGLHAGHTNGILADGLNGGLAINYNLVQQTLAAVQISPLPINITGLTTSPNPTVDQTNKTYDGTAIAKLYGKPVLNFGTLTGFLQNELTINNSTEGVFYDPASPNYNINSTQADALKFGPIHVAKGIKVRSFITIGDKAGLASNYTLIQPTFSAADIVPAPLVINGIIPVTRAYNGTTNVTLDTSNIVINGKFNNDTIKITNQNLGISALKNVGDQKVSYAGTFDPTLPQDYYIDNINTVIPKVTISPAPLSITGLSGLARSYNSKNVIIIQGNAVINGLVGTETVLLKNTASGLLVDKHVGLQDITTNISLLNGIGGLASNYQVIQPALPKVNITPAPLTIGDLRITSRKYDGTDYAKYITPPSLKGLVGGEMLTLSNYVYGTATSKNIGIQKVTASIGIGDKIGKGLASDYSLTQPKVMDINILPVTLTISGLLPNERAYDGTLNVTLLGTPQLNGLVSVTQPNGTIITETLTLINGSSAVIKKPNVGKYQAVSTAKLANGTGLASNYIIKTPTTAFKVNPANITITGLNSTDHTYNGTLIEKITGTPVLSGLIGTETLGLASYMTGRITTADIGVRAITTNMRLVSKTGTARNYQIVQPTLTPVNITPAVLTVVNMNGIPRAYNGQTTFKFTRFTLKGVQARQRITLTGYETAALASPNAGLQSINNVNLTVSTSGIYPITNYTLVQPVLSPVKITPVNLTLTGLKVNPKIFDGTTNMTLSGAIIAKGLVGLEQLNFGNATAGISNSAGIGNVAVTTSITLLDGVGGLAGNYTLTQPRLFGVIKK